MSSKTYRTRRRATDCALRSGSIDDIQTIDNSCIVSVINAQLLTPNNTLTIKSDFLCPIARLVREDAVIFGGTLYKRESAKQIIRVLLTKSLPCSQRGPRCIKNPLNPSDIIYSC